MSIKLEFPEVIEALKTFPEIPDYPYPVSYPECARQVESGEVRERDMLGTLLLDDLFFMVYFVLGWAGANHPFLIDACYEIQNGPEDDVLYVWGREHGKSTVVTIADTIRRILRDPESRICIFSYKKELAVSFFSTVKETFERSDLIRWCFPDIMWNDPAREAPKWGVDGGLIVKRTGVYKEATLEAHGMVEGMPTGKHYTRRIYDDVVTLDLVSSPETMKKVERAFWMSENLGTDGGTRVVVGTPYHHEDLIAKLMVSVDGEGKPIFRLSKKPTLEGGEPSGRPVFLSEERVRKLRQNERTFFSQHLLNPTPRTEAKLKFENLDIVPLQQIPSHLYRFMVVDSAGSVTKAKSADAWACWLIGVEPYRDDVGASDVYILDGFLDVVSEDDALRAIVEMYIRGGRIIKLGVEKVALSSAEMHIAHALSAKGKKISLEMGNLVLVRPGGREKHQRILDALGWPLNHGKIHIAQSVPKSVRDRLRMEMEKFPFGPDDGCDALAYLYDLISEYHFPPRPAEVERDIWEERAQRRAEAPRDWWMC